MADNHVCIEHYQRCNYTSEPASHWARVKSERRREEILDQIIDIIRVEKERGNRRVPLPKNLIRRVVGVDPRTLQYNELCHELEDRQRELYGKVIFPVYEAHLKQEGYEKFLIIADPVASTPLYAIPLTVLESLREMWLVDGGEPIEPFEDIREALHFMGRALQGALEGTLNSSSAR